MNIKLSKTEWWIFIVFGLILLFLPYVFTLDSGIINFKGTGEIGDTIGGVTAPFLGFFGSILVYLALKAQIEANRQVQEQFKKQESEEQIRDKIQFHENRINLLKSEINSFYYSFTTTGGAFKNNSQKYNYEGSQAIYKLLKNNTNTFFGKKKRDSYEIEPKLFELKELLTFFKETVQVINNEIFYIDELQNKHVKAKLLTILNYYFNSKLKGVFQVMGEFKEDINGCNCGEQCERNHGLPVELFLIIGSIEKSLVENN